MDLHAFPLALLQGTETSSPPAGAEGGPAQATEGAPGGEGGQKPVSPCGENMLVPLLFVFAIFWFVLIRPERKQRKQREEMLSRLSKGDKVVTTSGMFGTIVQVQDGVATVQVADGVRLRFTVSAIQQVLRDEDSEGDEGGK